MHWNLLRSNPPCYSQLAEPMEKRTDLEQIKGQLHKLGIQSEVPLDNGFEFRVSGIPFELLINDYYDSETELYGTLLHLSKVHEECDSFIMRLAVEDTEQHSGEWVTYLEDKQQIGFFAFPVLLNPTEKEIDLPEAIQGILEYRKEIQDRYQSMQLLVRLSTEEDLDTPGDVLLLEEDHQRACEAFPFWKLTLSTEGISEAIDEMGMEHEVVDLIDDISPGKPILFWSDSEMYLIQEENNRLTLYAKRIIDFDRIDLFGPACRFISNRTARTEYKLEYNVCTVLTRLPEDTDHNNLGNRLRICIARLNQFLEQLTEDTQEARKIEATPEQMKKYFIYEVIRNNMAENGS